MQVGDLVYHYDEPGLYGVVINIRKDVEIPSLIRILWADHMESSHYADDLVVVSHAGS